MTIDPDHPDYTNTPASPTRPDDIYVPADPAAPPQASILTPFYNATAIFDETATAIRRQSFQQYEWIVVNDGSTDERSLTLLDRCRHADPRIRVIDHPRNRGLSAARNTGFREARTPYVLQLDDDDLVEPTMLEKCLWALVSHPEYGFVGPYSIGFGAEQYTWTGGFHYGEKFLEHNWTCTGVLVRKTAHEAAGGYDEQDRGGLMDWDFWLRCANAGIWGGNIPEYLYWYRRRSDHSDRWTDMDGGENFEQYREGLRRKYPRLYEGGFPTLKDTRESPWAPAPETPPFDNALEKRGKRVLVLVSRSDLDGPKPDWFAAVADAARNDCRVSVALVEGSDPGWLSRFGAVTPDCFALETFLRPIDYPRFLGYLVRSRRFDAVVAGASELGCLLLPYLRRDLPGPDWVVCLPAANRAEAARQASLAVFGDPDLYVAADEGAADRLIQAGASKDRVAIGFRDLGRIVARAATHRADRNAPDAALDARRQATLAVRYHCLRDRLRSLQSELRAADGFASAKEAAERLPGKTLLKLAWRKLLRKAFGEKGE